MPFKTRFVNICGCISFKSAPIAQKEMHFLLQDTVFISKGRLIYMNTDIKLHTQTPDGKTMHIFTLEKQE